MQVGDRTFICFQEQNFRWKSGFIQPHLRSRNSGTELMSSNSFWWESFLFLIIVTTIALTLVRTTFTFHKSHNRSDLQEHGQPIRGRQLTESIELNFQMSGTTGSGKSLILETLQKRGEQVLVKKIVVWFSLKPHEKGLFLTKMWRSFQETAFPPKTCFIIGWSSDDPFRVAGSA